ncbi:MAG TPA: penicillin acylase family protein, partial [Bacteroidota bacterium]
LIGIGFFFLTVFLVLAYLAYHLATKSFPVTDGSVVAEGLEKPVDIYRDSFGVPHIFAESHHDAWFAAGFVQAQDRLWQMEVIRRAGLGRLAEVLGPPALNTDKLFRTLGLRRLAEETAKNLDAETRAALGAYADGVNACMRGQQGRYALEFDMLGFEPEPWTIEHSLLLSKLMAWELNTSRWVDITYGYVVQRVGPQRARDLYPDWPDNAPVTVPSELKGEDSAELGLPLLKADASFRKLLGLSDFGTGSNAWAVAPSKSLTGHPVLANDPHLVLTTPGRWYEMHLSAPGLDVMGASIPGIPFVVIGRNRDIAWGATSAMVDDIDYYVEEVDSVEHPTQYKVNDHWTPIGKTVDTILVKDGIPVVLTSYATHRGPIVNRIEPAAEPASRLLSMRWVAGEVSHEARAVMRVNRAKNWMEFREALKDFSSPSQNFLYADVRGNIGYVLAGRIPLRADNSFASPYPGWTDRYDWQGFVPFAENPSLYNPPHGFIVSANNRIVGADYPHYVSNNWEPPWRAARIVELLSREGPLSLEDQQRVQLDLVSAQARTLVPRILQAYRDGGPENDDVKTTLNYFRNWNYVMREENVSTTLFESFLLRMIQNTFSDELGPELSALYDTLASKPLVALTVLLEQDSSAWFDDIATEQVETKNGMIRRSLVESLAAMKSELGGELKEWRWGELHQVEFRHLFGENPLLRGQFNRGPFPVGGSHSTVWKGDFRLRAPFVNHLGPSARFIFDLSDANNTRSVIPPGQSGHLYHRDYDNQIPLWRHGAYKVEPMDRTSIERMVHQLNLRPAE